MAIKIKGVAVPGSLTSLNGEGYRYCSITIELDVPNHPKNRPVTVTLGCMGTAADCAVLDLRDSKGNYTVQIPDGERRFVTFRLAKLGQDKTLRVTATYKSQTVQSGLIRIR